MRLSIKSTFHVHIGTVKFATQFKESPCSPAVTFPSFGSEGHGFLFPEGDPLFFVCFAFFVVVVMFVLESIDFFCTIFFFSVLPEFGEKIKDLLRKDIKAFLTLKYIHFAMSFFISNRHRAAKVWILIGRSFFFLLGKDLVMDFNKNLSLMQGP